MSRRKDSQQLVADLAKVLDSGSRFDRRMPAAEARRIKAEAAREQKEQRENSMRHLLRRQYGPWLAAGGVFAVGAVCWLIRWLIDPLTAVSVAFLLGVAAGFSAWMIGHRTKRWAGRVHFAAVVASSWLLWTAWSGPSWLAVLVLVLGAVVSSLRWWQANRIPIPKKPNRGPAPVPVETIEQLWEANLGAQGRVLAGSVLTVYDEEPKPGCKAYRINLIPGKQTITGTISYLDLIAGGLMTPVERVLPEPDPDRNPNHVKLTIVEHSPIEETLPYNGARLVGEQRHMIEVGPYGDGDGYARWRMWQPGEMPNTGSWLSGLVIAGTGIGKSRLMELLATGYMASGCAVVWFVDPQGGASSPALQEYADWYVSSEGTAKMISALEQIAEAREKENSVRGWIRFDPTPERPGLVVMLDECHVTIERYGSRLEKLARKCQKVGIAFVGLTQAAGLDSLGKDTLRASLMANLIVMKTGSNQTKNLLPGLPVDPETLPKIPGYGYSVGTDGSRTAPFRSEYLAKPEHWFKRYPMPKLDLLSANAAGDLYGLRREEAAAEQEENRRWVEEMSSEGFQPPAAEPDLDDWGTPEPAAFQVVRFPSAVPPPERPARERVLAAVAQGITRTALIADEVGLKPSQLHAVLKKLVEDRELQQPTRGVYRIAGSEGNVED